MHQTQSSELRGMDLNLLVVLDALLIERSVTGAAARLHLSEPAVSRALGRIRRTLDDPILVRAGRVMTPTPHAQAIEPEVRELIERVQRLFTSARTTDLRTVTRDLTVLAHYALPAVYGPALLQRAAAEAPGISLRFVPESHVDLPLLRDGVADLEIGIIDSRAPELHIRPVHSDHMIGVARRGHPALRDNTIRIEDYARARHLSASRRGRLTGPIDTALAERGFHRTVVASVADFPTSLFFLTDSDLIGNIPACARSLAERLGLTTFDLPLETPPLPYALAWHPRNDADPAHIWLRDTLREIMLAALDHRPTSRLS
ncbi:LysR family transcriptional regulator [Nocardia sp. CDC160]|uniref:LysR family transcriptional regulator n=1 Tax=Nocardia sp. CDC160 TaxID=3112166 RepID=UPI002DBE9B64|nr:LysR family transcriptional regulator [Nocardia sp. CDC160]MEC3920412.1 LysR family transcriptional regulator [Nocardia sp. CDC160]